MATDFENFVNANLPLKVGFASVPSGGNATAGRYPRFTGVGLTIAEAEISTSIAQIVTVGATGAQYTTIQAAIDSIVDATSTKKYAINIAPGIYDEQLTPKAYIDLIGEGSIQNVSAAVLVRPSTAGSKCITFTGLVVNSFRNISFQAGSSGSADNFTAIYVAPTATNSGTAYFYDCSFNVISSENTSQVFLSDPTPYIGLNFFRCVFARSNSSGATGTVIAFDVQQCYFTFNYCLFSLGVLAGMTGILFQDTNPFLGYSIYLQYCEIQMSGGTTYLSSMTVFRSTGTYSIARFYYTTFSLSSTVLSNTIFYTRPLTDNATSVIDTGYCFIRPLTNMRSTRTLIDCNSRTKLQSSYDNWQDFLVIGDGAIIRSPDNILNLLTDTTANLTSRVDKKLSYNPVAPIAPQDGDVWVQTSEYL